MFGYKLVKREDLDNLIREAETLRNEVAELRKSIEEKIDNNMRLYNENSSLRVKVHELENGCSCNQETKRSPKAKRKPAQETEAAPVQVQKKKRTYRRKPSEKKDE